MTWWLVAVVVAVVGVVDVGGIVVVVVGVAVAVVVLFSSRAYNFPLLIFLFLVRFPTLYYCVLSLWLGCVYLG